MSLTNRASESSNPSLDTRLSFITTSQSTMSLNFNPTSSNPKLIPLIREYDINPIFINIIEKLHDFEVVIICDDSGSMKTPLKGTTKTRWDHLKSIVDIVIDFATVLDKDGVDVYFLNRDPVFHVNDVARLFPLFDIPPRGLTPLASALRRVLSDKRIVATERKLLILIATDGAPTDKDGQVDTATVEQILLNERTADMYVTFLACTDDLACLSYLNDWDKKIPNLDVISDYESERKEVLRARGDNFPFSFGDYMVKVLLGAVNSWLDKLDESK